MHIFQLMIPLENKDNIENQTFIKKIFLFQGGTWKFSSESSKGSNVNTFIFPPDMSWLDTYEHFSWKLAEELSLGRVGVITLFFHQSLYNLTWWLGHGEILGRT